MFCSRPSQTTDHASSSYSPCCVPIIKWLECLRAGNAADFFGLDCCCDFPKSSSPHLVDFGDYALRRATGSSLGEIVVLPHSPPSTNEQSSPCYNDTSHVEIIAAWASGNSDRSFSKSSQRIMCRSSICRTNWRSFGRWAKILLTAKSEG